MRFLLGLPQGGRAAKEPFEPAADLALALAITQLLIDGGRADAAGTIVVATWRTHTQLAFEVICAERIRISLCALLARFLARPFHNGAHTWLLSQGEAEALIDLSAEQPRDFVVPFVN